MASKMARHFSSSVVIGFSVIASQPRSIARTMYSWWNASTVQTITLSTFCSLTIFSKSSAA